MGMVRKVLTSPSEKEAQARFRILAKEDGLLARHLFPRDPVRKPVVDGEGECEEARSGLALACPGIVRPGEVMN